MLFGAHYDDESGQTFTPDYVRDGAPTTTPTGTPTIISGGKFNAGMELNANEYVEYEGASFLTALVQTGAISFWVKPAYSGNPSTQQYFVFATDSGGFQNRVSIWHTASGFVQAYVNSSAGAVISSVSASWSPSSGTWYHFELNYDVTTGETRVFIDGTQLGSTHAGTGTRTGTCDYLGVGTSESGSATQNYVIDEVAVFDAVQHTTTFTPPTAAFDMTPKALENGSFEAADGDTVAQPDGWQLYLASGSWALADFGAPFLFIESFEYGYDGNQDLLAALADGDIEQAVFNLLNREAFEGGWDNEVVLDEWPTASEYAEFDTGTPEDWEDFEDEWDNDSPITAFSPSDVSLALFDTGTPEDREDFNEEWDNDSPIAAFTPGILSEADFEIQGGVDQVEDFDASELDLDIPTSGLPKAGVEQRMSPTLGARIQFDATAFSGVVKIQTQSKGSGTWVDRSVVTSPSATVDLTEGYQAVRAYTESLTSGTPTATRHWPALE
ncbi:MAG: hypothetical protein GTN69_01880 [Armatimonadetes bacterium]|nr:hypothetical protein [Armatimonadota bacterium]